jgi:hypothetical protein
MDPPDDLWAAIRDVLPDPEELTAAVAAELREPADDVRPSVLIGTIALNGQLGPEPVAAAAIEAELGRIHRQGSTRSVARALDVDSLDVLLDQTRALAANGSLDLTTIVGIQRSSGAIAARTGRPIAVLLHRYAVTRRLIWERCVDALQTGGLDPATLAAFGRLLLLWNELTWLAVTDGYRMAEREILARAVEARRGALQEILGVVAGDAAGAARLRRLAVRHGLDPDQGYRLVAIAPGPDSDPIPERPGIGEEELEVHAGRIGHLLGSAGPGVEGAGAGIRLPAVLPLMGRIAVLAGDERSALARLPATLDSVLGGLATAAGPQWVAVGSGVIHGVEPLPSTYADLVDATRTAQRLGLGGWIPDAEQLALERLLLADRDLADAMVRQELGPVLADERFGAELVETLQAYFDAGENVTAAGRRLNLATRTVTYRLEKVESLLGHPLDDQHRRRLSTALLAHRLRSGD